MTTDTPQYLDGFLAALRPVREGVSATAPHAGKLLPPEERIKRLLHPLDSFARLLDCAENDRPPAPDDRFRFRWFGLFYQAPRQDAFLLRLRLPGGRLEAFQLAALADITQELAAGHVLLNAQGGLDVPGVPVRAAAEILRRVEGVGLCARQTGGDCVQSVRGGEDEGSVADDPRAPVYPLVRVLEQTLGYRRDLADLPRGCEIIFQRDGDPPATGPEGEPDTLVLQAVTGHDSAFRLIVPGDTEGGFVLRPNRVVPGCLRLLETWAADADRTDRQRAALAGFCHALGHARIAALLGSAPWQARHPQPGASSLCVDGNPPGGLVVPGGRLLSGQLILIGKIVQEIGPGGVRLMHGRLHPGRSADDAARAAIASALAREP